MAYRAAVAGASGYTGAELLRRDVGPARAVANPGWDPRGAIRGGGPGGKAGRMDPGSGGGSAAAGVSRAGRELTNDAHSPQAEPNFKAYGLPTHKHTPEI